LAPSARVPVSVGAQHRFGALSDPLVGASAQLSFTVIIAVRVSAGAQHRGFLLLMPRSESAVLRTGAN
jgi:hypothetical protein